MRFYRLYNNHNNNLIIIIRLFIWVCMFCLCVVRMRVRVRERVCVGYIFVIYIFSFPFYFCFFCMVLIMLILVLLFYGTQCKYDRTHHYYYKFSVPTSPVRCRHTQTRRETERTRTIQPDSCALLLFFLTFLLISLIAREYWRHPNVHNRPYFNPNEKKTC